MGMVMMSNQSPIIPMEAARRAKTEKSQVRLNVKVLLTVFFDYNDAVHREFLPQDRTINKEYNLEVMCRLHETIRKKRPEQSVMNIAPR